MILRRGSGQDQSTYARGIDIEMNARFLGIRNIEERNVILYRLHYSKQVALSGPCRARTAGTGRLAAIHPA